MITLDTTENTLSPLEQILGAKFSYDRLAKSIEPDEPEVELNQFSTAVDLFKNATRKYIERVSNAPAR